MAQRHNDKLPERNVSILPASVKAYIGMETTEVACEVVERGAVRRFAQAVMDEDPIYREPCAANAHCGGPVAPALYPMYMINWRQFGDADCVQQHAQDPHFDGTAGLLRGLPEIEPPLSTARCFSGSISGRPRSRPAVPSKCGSCACCCTESASPNWRQLIMYIGYRAGATGPPQCAFAAQGSR